MKPSSALRLLVAIAGLVSLTVPPNVAWASDFAPNPRQAFEGFVAINPPLHPGPHRGLSGSTATARLARVPWCDNLETVRSLNGLTIDKTMQLSLTIGLLQLFGIDPKARDHYVARFGDLSIVKVKDSSRLPGVKGEPRIIEALKAGTVTISSDSEIGLSGQRVSWRAGEVQASGGVDRARQFSIDARDMFIAIRIATTEAHCWQGAEAPGQRRQTHGEDGRL